MPAPSRLKIVAAFAAIYVIWGSTYLGILFAIQSIPPLLMAGTRYFSAGVIMYIIARLQGAPRSGWVDWRTAAIIGACLIFGGNGGVTIAEQYVPTGLAAVLIATVPIYIALLSWLTGTGARPTTLVWLGLAGGFGGVAILLLPSIQHADAKYPHALTGMLILLCSSFLWSAGSVYSRRAQNAPSPFLAAGQQMLCGGAMMLIVGVATGETRRFDPAAITWLSIWSWIYLVLIGAIIGFTAYIWLLRHVDPPKVATYAYVNPIVAVLLGTMFAGETLSLRTLLAASVIIGSVAVVITADQLRSKKPTPADAQPR
ncbi:drug/metabolite exporter YedA [soil metagenome]